MRGSVSNLDKNKAQDTKQKLLDSAIEVFSEKGFDGARVDEIAARAKVNKAMLYYYFNSKEKLFEELIMQYKQDFKDFRETLVKDTYLDEESSLEFLFEELYKFISNKKDLLRIIIIESIKANSSNDSIFNSILPSAEIKVSRLKDKGIEVEDTVNLMLSSFYYMLVPAAAFIIVGDKWSEFYGFDKEEVKKKFLQVYKEIRKNYISHK
ncbi:hypothetical protein C1I91_12870 [Clostridium manihotivorum]|uniref:HTH tetR-type domain-containing protein n=1 Tax=Clostridium manihotivorum TaxID=2320868 RepID=A0A410DTW2_9CLOT|nr:hypothetical protein C1I91_12870 [Clostridium manihotivorum]